MRALIAEIAYQVYHKKKKTLFIDPKSNIKKTLLIGPKSNI